MPKYLTSPESPKVFPSNVLLGCWVLDMGVLVKNKGRLAFSAAGPNGPQSIWFLLNASTIRNGNLNTPGFVSDGETWHEVINRNLGLDTPRKVYIKESEYILTTVDQELILAVISHYTTGMRTRT